MVFPPFTGNGRVVMDWNTVAGGVLRTIGFTLILQNILKHSNGFHICLGIRFVTTNEAPYPR